MVIELLRRCPELRRAVLPHGQPNDTEDLPFGATLARCLCLEQLRLVKHGADLHIILQKTLRLFHTLPQRHGDQN